MSNSKNSQYEIKNLNEAFTQIPNSIILDKNLNNSDFRLLCFYISVSINKNISFYSLEKIKESINLSKRKIIESNKVLENLKYINIKKRFNSSNIITILKYSRAKKSIASAKKSTLQVQKSKPNNIKYNNINLNSEANKINKNSYYNYKKVIERENLNMNKRLTQEEQDFINNLKNKHKPK